MITISKRLSYFSLGAGIILLIPLVAMQFTDSVSWDLIDFAVAGTILIVAGLVIDFCLRKIQKTTHRIIVCLIIVLAVVLIWAELAVGILETILGGS